VLPAALRLVISAVALCALGAGLVAATFAPHAERVLDIAPADVRTVGIAALVLALVAALAAGRIRPERRRSALLAGVVLLAAGLLATTVGVALPGLASAVVPAAIGAGLVLRLAAEEIGIRPLAAAFALLAVAAAAAAAFPLADLLVEAGLSYRNVLSVGGFVALAAAVPVIRRGGTVAPATLRAVGSRAAIFGGATIALLLVAQVVHRTALLDADRSAFEALHGLGDMPRFVETLFVEPNLRNYVVIVLVVGLVGARLWGRTTPGRTLLLVAGAGCVAYVGVRTCWALWERPRPEEVLGVAPAEGHSWAPYPSFPSGHMAVTTALALSTAMLVPKLRYLLWAYAAIIAFTRLSYGAHFPSDVLLGFVMGALAAAITVRPLHEPFRLPRVAQRRAP